MNRQTAGHLLCKHSSIDPENTGRVVVSEVHRHTFSTQWRENIARLSNENFSRYANEAHADDTAVRRLFLLETRDE